MAESPEAREIIDEQFSFIDEVLAFEGLITNERIRRRFTVKTVQASRILANYRERYPRNLTPVRGQGRGRYQTLASFKPAKSKLDVVSYFAGAGRNNACVEIYDARQDLTQVEPLHFRTLFRAIMDRTMLAVVYRSMNHPNGLERIVQPRAFAYAGRRWHVRAFDSHSGEFRDFNLARFRSIYVSTASGAHVPDKDLDWEARVTLVLRPHEQLTEDQQRLIQDEFFNGAAQHRVTTRRSMVDYVLRELEVAAHPAEQVPPTYQLQLHRIEPVAATNDGNKPSASRQ